MSSLNNIFGYRSLLKSSTTSIDDFMQQGKGPKSGISIESIDPKELQRGVEVEMEHTDDPKIAQKIVWDHEAETPKDIPITYYEGLGLLEDFFQQLKKMEPSAAVARVEAFKQFMKGA